MSGIPEYLQNYLYKNLTLYVSMLPAKLDGPLFWHGRVEVVQR